MEIFTFVQMRGKKDDMVIMLLDKSDADVTVRLMAFDAGKARCYLAQDRHALLAVIEAAFGTFEPLNKIVRGLLSERLALEGVEPTSSGMGQRVSNLFTDGKRGSILRKSSMRRSSTMDPPRDLDAEVKV